VSAHGLTVTERQTPSVQAAPAPLPPAVEEQPGRGGTVWCVWCPEFWAQAESRAQARWLVEEHMRLAHPKAVSR
jgi:hypothetical protein